MKPLRPLRPGQPERRIHDYQRHETASLLAALDVTVGSVIGRCYKRHRAIEFRRFLDDIDANVALQPDVPIVLDNASRHKDQAHPQLTWPPAALRSALCIDLGFLDQSGRALLRPADREANSSRCPPIGRGTPAGDQPLY
jgi:hypothetical protein